MVSLALTLLIAALPRALPAGSPPLPQLELQLVVDFLTDPVIITHAGDGSGRLFVGDKDGRIWVFTGGQLLATPFLDIRSSVQSSASEQGLLGLAFHPQYEVNGYFYVYYSAPDTTGNPSIDHFSIVSRFSVSDDDANLANPGSELVLLTQAQPDWNHNCGNLVFGPDGYLYIGFGDGGSAGDPLNNGQNPDSLLGSILRIDVDAGAPYAIPADNPFVGGPGADEIWAWGLRNPWRFTFDRATGDLFIGDVGQGNWEEIDFQPAASTGGENYGWRCYEGNHAYNISGCGDPADYVFPILEYSHGQGCSVTGGFRYRGSDFPNLVGYYLYADYCSGTIWGATEDGGWSTVPLLDSGKSISTFGEDENGELYLADRSGDRAIYRIVDNSPLDQVFDDGFEFGDTSQWSFTAP